MSRRAFTLMMIGIILLFAVVWGGVWYWDTSTKEHVAAEKRRAEQERIEAAQAKLRFERDRVAKLEIENREREEQEAIKRAKFAAEDAKRAAAQKQKKQQLEEMRRKRIDLFTTLEKQLHDLCVKELPTSSISDIPNLCSPRGIRFLIDNYDLYDEFNAKGKIAAYAIGQGAQKLVDLQSVTDEKSQYEIYFAFAVMMPGDQRYVLYIAEQLGKEGAAALSDESKRFVRLNPRLFPKQIP